MTSQPSKAADEPVTEASRKPSLRKRVAMLIGLASSLVTGLMLGMPQRTGKSEHIRFSTDPQGKGVSNTEYSYWTVVKTGWPVTYYVNDPNGSGIKVDWSAVYIDIVICVLLTIGAGIGMGRLVWCLRWPPQFSMRAMFNWTLVVATLLGVVPLYLKLSSLLHHDVSPIVPMTALIALALTVFAASWTLLFTARWWLKMRKSSS